MESQSSSKKTKKFFTTHIIFEFLKVLYLNSILLYKVGHLITQEYVHSDERSAQNFLAIQFSEEKHKKFPAKLRLHFLHGATGCVLSIRPNFLTFLLNLSDT